MKVIKVLIDDKFLTVDNDVKTTYNFSSFYLDLLDKNRLLFEDRIT